MVFLGSAATALGAARFSPAAATTVVTVDGRRPGPAFQGIGAISGGGGNSRYLIDYPPRARRAILDVLFDPHRGAALQMLKLEVGSGSNSSDGAEPSVEPTPGHVTCRVGYEFWLARQALRRNPHLRLYGLQWSAPAWVRGRGDTLWTRRDIAYLLAWLGCARRAGLRIDYLGGWNEHYVAHDPVIERWYVALRRALDVHGYRYVRVVAADAFGGRHGSTWSIADDMAEDPALARSVDVIGIHDGCGPHSKGFACRPSAVAEALARGHKALLWDSELGRTPNVPLGPLEQGAGGLARSLDNSYIDARITGTLLWPLVDAMPPGLPYAQRGLVTADQPWSGVYSVSDLVWVVAQTTQFAEPGWHFVDGASGRLRHGGSFVTYENPGRTAWSMVAQTSTARSSQLLRLHVTGGLPRAVSVWVTGLTGGPRLAEVRRRVVPHRGWLALRLAPGDVYTITTTTGQDPEPTRAATPSRFRLPYVLARDGAGMARMLAPMEGSFQYVHHTLTQTNVGAPVPWMACRGAMPYAVVGQAGWRRYAVGATIRLPRASTRNPSPGGFVLAGDRGYRRRCHPVDDELRVTSTGRWALVRNGPTTSAVLAAGQVAASRRYRLVLVADGRRIVASIDHRRVATVEVAAPTGGLAGLGSLGYYPVRYARFSVRRARGLPPG